MKLANVGLADPSPGTQDSEAMTAENEQDVEKSLDGNETAKKKHPEEQLNGCYVFVAHRWLHQIM